MIHRPRVRNMIAAVGGATMLALGPVLIAAAPANAAPTTTDPNYPLGGGENQQSVVPHQDPTVQRAEDFAGDSAGRAIDLGAHILKCGIGVVAPSVECS